ncbi:MAG TPA: head decoration protein [Clostridiaceae bacterium]|nr:head decoration protein [Clostridiaceae bacterium]
MKLNGQIGTFTPDNLIAGENVPLLVKAVTIVTGQGVLNRGSVLGIISASNKGKLAAKASADGSQVAKYILAEDVDASSVDVVAQCYESGLFNRKALIFAADNTAADHEDSLRQYGIFLKDNIVY